MLGLEARAFGLDDVAALTGQIQGHALVLNCLLDDPGEVIVGRIGDMEEQQLTIAGAVEEQSATANAMSQQIAVLADIMRRGQWRAKDQIDFALLSGALILLNGIFAMSELAIVSARTAQLRMAADRGSSAR